MRAGLVLALLVSVVFLLGLSAAAHSHDGRVSPSQCEVCRWASDATPLLAVLLVVLLTLPESGPTHIPARVFWTQTARRRHLSRGPPLD